MENLLQEKKLFLVNNYLIMKIRQMKFAGAFYPADPVELKLMLDSFWENLEKFELKKPLKAGVSPHAGYIYSGQVAAYTYEAIRQNLDNIPKTIFIMSPDHYIGMNKVLVGNYDELETPFWNLKVDKDVCKSLLENDLFTDEYLDNEQEHAQETQYPFLKYILGDKSDEFKIVPLVFGQVDVVKIFEILDNYVNNSFFIVSSDLSHYHFYDAAVEKDQKSLDIIVNKKINEVNNLDACGIFPLISLLLLANKYNWTGKLLKYLNSWDTAWDKIQVVGYGSVVYY